MPSLLPRLLFVAPLLLVAAARHLGWAWDDGVRALTHLAPEQVAPTAQLLEAVGAAQLAVGALYAIGVFPALTSLLVAAAYLAPVGLLAGSPERAIAALQAPVQSYAAAAPLHPYFAFILLFHAGLGAAALFGAVGAAGRLKRLALMAPVLWIGISKVKPERVALLAEALHHLAPGSQLPPQETLHLIGGVEVGLTLLVFLGAAPKLTHTLAALHLGVVPVLHLGASMECTPYYVYVLSLHVATAAALQADAWAGAPREPTAQEKRIAERNLRRKQA